MFIQLQFLLRDLRDGPNPLANRSKQPRPFWIIWPACFSVRDSAFSLAIRRSTIAESCIPKSRASSEAPTETANSGGSPIREIRLAKLILRTFHALDTEKIPRLNNNDGRAGRRSTSFRNKVAQYLQYHRLLESEISTQLEHSCTKNRGRPKIGVARAISCCVGKNRICVGYVIHVEICFD
jgi:hypothetical protein